MKDMDEATERVLRELGGAEAPEGMERRVLARVELAAGEGRTRFGGGFAAMPWYGLALAAALLMVVGGFAWRGELVRRGARVRVPVTTARMGSRAGASAQVAGNAVRGTVAGDAGRGTAAGDAARGAAAAAVGGGRALGIGGRREFPAGRRREVAAGRGRAVAVGEVSTARRLSVAGLQNRPAPEEPLTEEERMLLRIARRGRPEEYAALNMGVQEARMSAETAEFGKFFEPPTVVTGARN